jgi:nucleoporin NUP82
MVLQQKEFERQVIALRNLYDRLQNVNSEDAKAKRQDELKKLTKTHNELRLRVEEQVRRLVNCYQPNLSKQEKKFASKLETLSKQISGDGGQTKRIEMVIIDWR